MNYYRVFPEHSAQTTVLLIAENSIKAEKSIRWKACLARVSDDQENWIDYQIIVEGVGAPHTTSKNDKPL